jgi:hypothetical protein
MSSGKTMDDDARLALLLVRLEALLAGQQLECALLGAIFLAIVGLCGVILWALG